MVRAQLVQFVVAQRPRARGCAAASATEATVASSGEQWRAVASSGEQWRAVASSGEQGSEQCGAPNFFDGLGQWACQEAAGREKLGSKTPAPAQEVGVSRRRPLARAPCLRGSEFFDRPSISPWPKYRFRSGPPQILISKFRGAAANFEVDFDCQNVSVLAQDRAYRRRTPRCAGTSRLCPLARPFCRERAPAACKRWLAP